MKTDHHPLLDQVALAAALQEVQRLVGDSGALAGGIAMYRLGARRFVPDVEFVVSAYPSGLKLGKELACGGCSAVTTGGVPVSLIVGTRDFEQVYREAVLYARTAADGVRVVAPEYLCALAMARSGRVYDVELEWLVSSGTVELEKARHIIKTTLGSYAALVFERCVGRAWLGRR